MGIAKMHVSYEFNGLGSEAIAIAKCSKVRAITKTFSKNRKSNNHKLVCIIFFRSHRLSTFYKQVDLVELKGICLRNCPSGYWKIGSRLCISIGFKLKQIRSIFGNKNGIVLGNLSYLKTTENACIFVQYISPLAFISNCLSHFYTKKPLTLLG